jgi:predicted transcriptional regulator of viral defense system
VYRIAHYPADRFAQYREAVLWAQAHKGPTVVAISHETALILYGISDVNPAKVHLTVPVSARLRRTRPKWITVHHAELAASDITLYEGIPVTTIARSVIDVLRKSKRIDTARQAIADAAKQGLLSKAEVLNLRKIANHWAHTPESAN